jgi:hypothetical protein
VSGHPNAEALVDYVAAALPEGQESALEEHLFECDACGATASALAQLGEAVRAAIAGGKTGLFATDALLAELERSGVPLRHYSVDPGGRVDCTVAAEDVFIVAHYSADFTGAPRVTVVVTKDEGVELRRMEDLPVPPGARTLHVLIRADSLRRLPSGTHTVTLHAEGRVIARYTFSHSAFAG